MTKIQSILFESRDEKYREFNASLLLTVDKENIIGVRTPRLRGLARALIQAGDADGFINSLPHRYFEENQLHAFIISEEKDFPTCRARVKEFLPYVDNWATCDQLSPRCFKHNPHGLLSDIYAWLESAHPYEKRFGIICLMRYFLDDKFKSEYSDRVAAVKSDDYYVKMAVAWYFATALTEHYDEILPYLSESRLDAWTHNKAIQKARESFRVSKEHKKELNLLKR